LEAAQEVENAAALKLMGGPEGVSPPFRGIGKRGETTNGRVTSGGIFQPSVYDRWPRRYGLGILRLRAGCSKNSSTSPTISTSSDILRMNLLASSKNVRSGT